MIVDEESMQDATRSGGMTLIQLCFVVADLDAAMGGFTQALGAGPWFVDGGPPSHQDPTLYRGELSPLSARFALGYAGDTMFELVEPAPRSRSIFREWADTRGFGLHHLGFGVDDFDASAALIGRTGGMPLTTSVTPRGARICIYDPAPRSLVLHEIIELLPGNRHFYDFMRREAARWDRASLVFKGTVPGLPA